MVLDCHTVMNKPSIFYDTITHKNILKSHKGLPIYIRGSP